MVRFKPVNCPDFPVLPSRVAAQLRSDQKYSDIICIAAISESDQAVLEIGPPHHKRWFTLACDTVLLHVTAKKPSKTLCTLAEFW